MSQPMTTGKITLRESGPATGTGTLELSRIAAGDLEMWRTLGNNFSQMVIAPVTEHGEPIVDVVPNVVDSDELTNPLRTRKTATGKA